MKNTIMLAIESIIFGVIVLGMFAVPMWLMYPPY